VGRLRRRPRLAAHPRPDRPGGGRPGRGAARGLRPARACPSRGSGPHQPAPGRAERRDLGADHRGERQADHVVAWRSGAGRVHLPLGRRRSPPVLRRAAAPRHRPRRDRTAGADPPLPPRAGPRDRPVQLPAQPGGAQGGAGAGGRGADPGEAGLEDAAVGARARRHHQRDRAAAADGVGADRHPRRHGRAAGRPAASGGVTDRLGSGR